jgi:hypothetical protein
MDNNKDIGYINGNELVFNPDNSIQSGGFSVSSIMMKSGMSPIMTMNVNTDNIVQNGGSNKVSDLFQNLAVPNWTTVYNMKGGEYKEQDNKKNNEDDNDSDSDIDDDLHDKLLDLVKEHESKVKKKNNKTKRKDKIEKKNKTKRKKYNQKKI